MNPPVTVTGANGHIGSHLVRALLESGTEVRAVIRKNSDAQGLQDKDGNFLRGVHPVYADLLDKEALREALQGTTLLYHTAALFKTRSVTEQEIMTTNVTGARNLLDVCKDSKTLDRIVWTSSVATIGCSRTATGIRNESSFNDKPIDAYVASKVEAERIARDEYCQGAGLPIVFMNPGTVLGDLDFRMTPSNSFLVLAIRRPPPFYYDGGHSYVCPRPVAEAHIRGAKVGVIGERYILAGENIDMRTLFSILSETVQSRKPYFKLGPTPIGILASGFEVLGKLSNRPPLITREKALQLCSYYGYYDSDKAKAKLGYQPRKFSSILDNSLSWYRHMKWI